MSQGPGSLADVRCGLDLDGVLCDIGPGVAARIEAHFGVRSHPGTWRTFDLRRLDLGVPAPRFGAFLDSIFADPELYSAAPPVSGAVEAAAEMRIAGWSLVGITARPDSLSEVTVDWLHRQGIDLEEVHHAPMGQKSAVAARLSVQMTIEDNPDEADLLAQVCDSWLLDQPYNRAHDLVRARRLSSWDDAIGRFCQLDLFAAGLG